MRERCCVCSQPVDPSEGHTYCLRDRACLVSEWAFGPGVPERSEFGTLERVGVKQCVDLPGVGEKYQSNNSHRRCFVSDIGACAGHSILSVTYFYLDEEQPVDAMLHNEGGAIDGECYFTH